MFIDHLQTLLIAQLYFQNHWQIRGIMKVSSRPAIPYGSKIQKQRKEWTIFTYTSFFYITI